MVRGRKENGCTLLYTLNRLCRCIFLCTVLVSDEVPGSLLYVLSPSLPVRIRTVSIRIIRISGITLRISGRVLHGKQVSGKVRLIWCFARTRLGSVGRFILFKWESLDDINEASIP
jgi:hypothetical protein